MIDALSEYGRRSVDGISRIGHAYHDVTESAPEEIQDIAELVSSFLPGRRALDSVRMGNEAGRLWRDGRHGRALVTMGDAILAPLEELAWFVPGVGRMAGRAIP